MPVWTFARSQVTCQPRRQSARAERAANVKIETGGEMESSPPADLDDAWTIEYDDECVGARATPQGATPQRGCRHCQIKPVIQIRPLPSAIKARPIISACRKP